MADLSILMPVYNERATVEEAIRQVLDATYPVDAVELVIVDDGSDDGTRELLSEGSWGYDVQVHMHPHNQGKGAAIRTALGHAGGTYSAIMDADLEYDPADLGKLLPPLLAEEADVAFGIRGFEAHSAFSFWYVVGNKAVTLAANVLFNAWLADIMTCHKVMRTEVFRALELTASGFTIEPEITAKLLAAGFQIYEVPVRYNARGREEGKKLTTADGLRVLATLLRCRFAAGRLQGRVRHRRPARVLADQSPAGSERPS